MADTNKLSPVMQQYVDIKAEHSDALLMFRLGDFYEAFFEDAKTISDVLSLVLTSRGTGGAASDIPMCGIPWHAADNYFGRLVRAGFKVALVEQMETPAQAKARGHKFIERKVIRVLTPGTLTDENLLAPKKSNFLVAAVPTAPGHFDIVGCDISTGEFFVGDTDTVFDDMARINPAEIIYPASYAETDEIKHLRELWPTTPVYEKIYIRADIEKIVSQVFGTAIDSRDATKNVGGALCLMAGYLFNTQRDAPVIFRAARAYKGGAQLLIDAATWKSLEIDAPINDGGACLLDVIDRTHTAAGARRLRGYLRTLSADINVITTRENHISHLVMNRDVACDFSDMLSAIPDVGRCLTRLMSGRGSPRDMRNIGDFLINLPKIKYAAGRLDNVLAARFLDMRTHDDIAVMLKNALSDELPTFFRDGGVIRDGFDAALDNMRALSHGARETIAALSAEYSSATGIATLKIKYNNILGYFIEVPTARADALMAPESGFIHRQTMAGNMRFTTSRLIELDNDVRSAAEKAAGIEAEIISRLTDDIRNISTDILGAAELLADLDVWLALAAAATDYGWVCPKMTSDTTFEITGGRHPVIEYALRKRGDNFVRNDCNLNTHPIALLTGPNMAGKSTYLRQNALIVVLAHLGSFVPADVANIGICDQLFSRVGASDNLAAGQSTFMVEMSETANILNRATEKSFVIFDEIGRGTATYDGMAIAQSVLEFMNAMGARTLFATHYHELTRHAGGALNNVACLTIDVREHNNEIIFMHRIVPGVANRSYGIQVAKMAGMPASVVARADEILSALETGISQPAATVTTPPHANAASRMTRVCEDKDKPQLSLFG